MYSLPRASLCWSRLRGSLDTFRWSIPRHDWGCQLGNHSAQYQATRQVRSFVSTSSSSSAPTNDQPRWILYASTLLVVGGSGLAAYETNEPFRHTCLAAIRCSRVASELYQFLRLTRPVLLMERFQRLLLSVRIEHSDPLSSKLMVVSRRCGLQTYICEILQKSRGGIKCDVGMPYEKC